MAEFRSSTESTAPVDLTSKDDLVAAQQKNEPYMAFFWAAWHEPSKRNGQMQGIYQALSEKYASQSIKFYLVEAEKVPAVSEAMEIVVVPTFLAMIGTTQVGKLEGANPAELKGLVKSLAEAAAGKSGSSNSSNSNSSKSSNSNNSKSSVNTNTETATAAATLSPEELNAKLKKLINMSPVVLFMKGNPETPRCGFSRKAVELLKGQGVPFASFDILSDEEVRNQLKIYSDWPTYPQLYAKGELVGGLDIMKEMAEGDDFKGQLGFDESTLPANAPSLEERCKALINQAKVMVFIKGTPEEPRCGFSRTMVGLLNDQGLEYDYFDILTDDQVRAGLKILSDWPTYPQLYANGELVGGLDIVQEMLDSGESFKEQIGLT